jgi:uncharacterized protein
MLDTTATFNADPNPVALGRGQRQSTFIRLIVALLSLSVYTLAHQSARAQQPAAAMSETAAVANAALIKSAYDAFSRGDIPGAIAAFAEDISWHVPGRGPLSRDYRGQAEVLAFFGHFMELSHGTFRLQVDDVLAQGDRVVVLCTESAQRGGRKWSAPQVHVWTMKDGKATAFWEYEGDQQGDDEFWSSLE